MQTIPPNNPDLNYTNPPIKTGKTGNNTLSIPITTRNPEIGYADSWLAKKLQEDFEAGPTDREVLGNLVSDLQQTIKLESKIASSNELEVYKFKSRGFVDEDAYTYQDSYSAPAEVKEVLARFGSNTDQDFLLHNAIGDSMNMPSYYGVLILDDTGQYRIGIYDYLTATKLSDPDASQLEFIATNQSQEWAATQKYLAGRNLLTTSPSWKTQVKEVPVFSLDPQSGNYVKSDGTPLTLASVDPSTGQVTPNIPFDPNLFPNPTETIVTPNLVVYTGVNPRTGNDSNEPVTAEDAMPYENRIERKGLDFFLSDTQYERSLREYNLDARQNWARFTRVGNYGLADRSVALFGIGPEWIDPTVIPVVDAAAHWFSGFEFGGSGISDPRVVAKKYSTKTNGEEVYNLILEDKPLAFTLTLMGVDLEKIKNLQTAGEVFGYLNGTLIQNGVSKAIQTRTANDGWFTWAGRGIGTMAYHTLVAGDAVGQTVITVSTGGLGAIGAGAATLRSMATSSSRLTTLERLAQTSRIGTSAASQTKYFGLAWGGIEGFGRALRGINSALPVNFADHTVSGLKTILGFRKARGALTGAEVVQQTSKVKKVGSWLLNQSLEGFIEEGVQEFLGQTLDMQKGIRSSYDPHAIWSNAVDGLWAEPLLGGVLYGPSKGQNWVFSKLLTGGLSTQARILNLNPARVLEMEHYLAQFYGSYSDMTETERNARTKQVMRMVIVADSIERTTKGKLADKTESAKAISMLVRDINKASPGAGSYIPEAFAHIEHLVEELNKDYTKSTTTKERKAAIDEAIKEGVIVKDGNRLLLSSDAASDLAALLSIEQTNPDNAERGRVQFLQNKYTASLENVDEAERESTATKLAGQLDFLLKALSLRAVEMKANDFASPEVQTTVADSIEAIKEDEAAAVAETKPTTTVPTPKVIKNPKGAKARRAEKRAAKAAKATPAVPETTPTPTPETTTVPAAAPIAPAVPETTPTTPTVPEAKPLGGFLKPAGVAFTGEIETLLVSLGAKIDSLDIDVSQKNKIKTKVNKVILKNKNNLNKLQTFLSVAEGNPLDILNAC